MRTDLQEFDVADLYFDAPLPDGVAVLLEEAASGYADGEGEIPLLRAYFQAPDNLTVLVALYRFFYYQHRYDDALKVALRALDVAGALFGFSSGWQYLTLEAVANGALRSIGMVRFYLLALKGAGYLNLRLQRLDEGVAMLTKVRELDTADRLGADALLAIARAACAAEEVA